MRTFIAVLVVCLAVAMGAGAQSGGTTLAWTNAGGSNCLAVLTQNGQPIPPGVGYYCPFQSTSFVYPDGYASLYVEGVTLEGITVKQGVMTPVTKPDGTFSATLFTRTDVLIGNEEGSEVASWVGSTTQNYTLFTYKSCSRYKCVTKTSYANTGGSGTLVQQ